jgi:predicted small lipoprotein YifL
MPLVRIRIGLCLALAALAACGIKGEPSAPEPAEARSPG